jgi:deferrochelatase/peroxidase EfeB
LAGKLQEGIYYKKRPFSTKHNSCNDSFAVIFLKMGKNSDGNAIRKLLNDLMKLYDDLKRGVVYDLAGCKVPTGALSILLGYGPTIFQLKNIKRSIPKDFERSQFLGPTKQGGPILTGSGLKYSPEVHENLNLNNDIIIQFIGKTQLAVNRAIVETIYKLKVLDPDGQFLRFNKFYTGFQRDDGRSWMGFHDEVSNMKNAKERLQAITVDRIHNRLNPRDLWTEGGTYLTFLKIEVNLDIWRKIEQKHQEFIIGRDKVTGRPLIGVNKKGDPVTHFGPTASSVSSYDTKFHEHPNYFKEVSARSKPNTSLDLELSSTILSQSHVGRSRHLDEIDSSDPTSRRIFRQGFEFLEPADGSNLKKFRLGLNFVSFQNDPGRLFFILTHPDWMGNTNFGGIRNRRTNNLLSVLAAGVFFVPPAEFPFAGSSIFI